MLPWNANEVAVGSGWAAPPASTTSLRTTIVADAGRHPGIALARIDLDAPRVAACFTRDGDWIWKVDLLNDRRPDTYEPLTRPAVRQAPIPAGAPLPPRVSP